MCAVWKEVRIPNIVLLNNDFNLILSEHIVFAVIKLNVNNSVHVVKVFSERFYQAVCINAVLCINAEQLFNNVNDCVGV